MKRIRTDGSGACSQGCLQTNDEPQAGRRRTQSPPPAMPGGGPAPRGRPATSNADAGRKSGRESLLQGVARMSLGQPAAQAPAEAVSSAGHLMHLQQCRLPPRALTALVDARGRWLDEEVQTNAVARFAPHELESFLQMLNRVRSALEPRFGSSVSASNAVSARSAASLRQPGDADAQLQRMSAFGTEPPVLTLPEHRTLMSDLRASLSRLMLRDPSHLASSVHRFFGHLERAGMTWSAVSADPERLQSLITEAMGQHGNFTMRIAINALRQWTSRDAEMNRAPRLPEFRAQMNVGMILDNPAIDSSPQLEVSAMAYEAINILTVDAEELERKELMGLVGRNRMNIIDHIQDFTTGRVTNDVVRDAINDAGNDAERMIHNLLALVTRDPAILSLRPTSSRQPASGEEDRQDAV